jgi:hypothetical protein
MCLVLLSSTAAQVQGLVNALLHVCFVAFLNSHCFSRLQLGDGSKIEAYSPKRLLTPELASVKVVSAGSVSLSFRLQEYQLMLSLENPNPFFQLVLPFDS